MYLGKVLSQISEELVLSGRWIYGDQIEKEVHIIKSNFKAGSGDYEDDVDIREDQYGEFYGIRIGKYSSDNPFLGGDYPNLDMAKEYALNICPSLKWDQF